MPAKISLIGKPFGKLTVISEAEPKRFPGGHISLRWNCECVCGKMVVVTGSSLRSKDAKSCGCWHDKWGVKHGALSGNGETRTYRIWRSMKERCQNPKHMHYANYGGRGITVCEPWQKFEGFLADMGEAPEGLTIDRVDGNKGYEKSNCKWATPKQQGRNKRSNRVFTVRGITGCLSELAEHFGMRYGVLLQRLKLGWSIEKALFQPIEKRVARKTQSTPPNPPNHA